MMEVNDQIANKNTIFQQLANAMPIIVWSATADGVMDFFNTKWYDYFGIDESEGVSKDLISLIHPEEVHSYNNTWSECIKNGTPCNIEFRLSDKERPGEFKWFLGRALPIFDSNNKISSWYGTCTDINDQKISESSLKESEERFRFMSDIMPQQVWTATSNGALDYVNLGTVNYFGKTAEAIIGEGWQNFIHPSDLSMTIESWVKCLKTLQPYQVEFRLRSKDGQYRWHLGRATPYINYDNEVRWFGTNTDIEQHKKIEQQKDEFISMASHELKTPVTSLKGYTQILQQKFKIEKDDASFNLVSRMDNQINKLTKLINDLFDVSKMGSSNILLEKTNFDFKELVNETVDSVQLSTSRHKIIIESTESIIVSADKLRMEQVITNFLSNAIKYSPDADKIIVNYYKQKNNLVFTVKDFGIGIKKENLSKLFDRFYRVDNSSMKFQGLGLGLYISSQIIKGHNGSFWIESEPQKESTFFFVIPVSEESHGIIKTDNTSFYESDNVSMKLNADKKSLEVDWKGFQSLETVQKGCIAIIDFIKLSNYSKILNDNTNVLGNWSEASDWGREFFFPELERLGITHFAWIYSQSTFSQLAANKSIDIMHGKITTQFFTSVPEAKDWLNSVEK